MGHGASVQHVIWQPAVLIQAFGPCCACRTEAFIAKSPGHSTSCRGLQAQHVFIISETSRLQRARANKLIRAMSFHSFSLLAQAHLNHSVGCGAAHVSLFWLSRASRPSPGSRPTFQGPYQPPGCVSQAHKNLTAERRGLTSI